MASSSRRPLTLFPDINTLPNIEANSFALQQSAHFHAPVLNFPTLSIEQTMATQSDIEANHFTLKSCVETMTIVSNLSHWLQNRTSEVHRLNAQLSLLQSIYKDAQVEISALKKENKELKGQATSMARFRIPSHSVFDGWEGIISFGGLVNTKVESSRAP
ncbi:hypothetical protein ACSBR2_015361 [Camellia fascicularis]